MITIYHNSRCSKSRAGLFFLEEANVETQVIAYLKDELFTFDSLKNLISKTALKPEDLVRKHEDLFKKTYKGKQFSDDEWITILVENPKLLHRPIVENGDKAVWAQPAERINEIL